MFMARIGILKVRGAMPHYEELPFNIYVDRPGIIRDLSRWLRTKFLHLIKMRVQGQTVITEIYLSPVGVGLWGRSDEGFQAARLIFGSPYSYSVCS
jgi:hypothetical protein